MYGNVTEARVYFDELYLFDSDRHLCFSGALSNMLTILRVVRRNSHCMTAASLTLQRTEQRTSASVGCKYRAKYLGEHTTVPRVA